MRSSYDYSQIFQNLDFLCSWRQLGESRNAKLGTRSKRLPKWRIILKMEQSKIDSGTSNALYPDYMHLSNAFLGHARR